VLGGSIFRLVLTTISALAGGYEARAEAGPRGGPRIAFTFDPGSSMGSRPGLRWDAILFDVFEVDYVGAGGAKVGGLYCLTLSDGLAIGIYLLVLRTSRRAARDR